MPDPFEWIYIPGGQVIMRWSGDPAIPEQTVTVEPFYIAKYPITNAQYGVYVNETGRIPYFKHYWERAEFNQPLQPVIDLRWQESMAYCDWLSKKMGYLITLPTDAEWQRAAQGDDDRKYPWGNEWDSSRCNTMDGRIGHTTPVTQYPQGASPYGVMDMAGNCFEWCSNGINDSINPLTLGLSEEELWQIIRVFKGSGCSTSTISVDIRQRGATTIFHSYSTGIRLMTPVNPIKL